MSLNILLKNKNLIESFVSLSFLKIVNLMTPFLVLPFAVNSLGIDSYGRVALVLVINEYLLAVTGYGFSLSSTRDISKYRNSRIKVSYVYSVTIFSKIYLYLFISFIVCCIGLFFDYFLSEELFFLLFILLSQTFFPDWYFKGLEKMRFIAIFDLLSRLVFLLGVIFFVIDKDDGVVYLFFLGACQFFVTVLSNLYIIKKEKSDILWVSLGRVKSKLNENFPLFLNQFLPNMYSNFPLLLIGSILGSKEAGVFSILRQVVSLYSVFNNVLSMTFFSYLSNNKDRFKAVAKIYIIASFSFMILMIFGSEFLDYFFTVESKKIKGSYIMLVLGVFMISLYSVFATNFLIIYKKDKEVTLVTLIASIAGFLISYPLISFLGIVGGSISIFLSQTLMALGSIYYVICHKDRVGMNN